MTNHRGVMPNNIGGVVYILVFFMTMLGDNVLTFLNNSGSHYNLMLIMTNLFMVALLLKDNGFHDAAVDLLFPLMSGNTKDTAGEEEDSTDCKHCHWRFFPPSLCERELKMSAISFLFEAFIQFKFDILLAF